MKRLRTAFPLALFLPLAACGTASGDRSGVVTRDSAGVAIVESRAHVWGRSQGWRIDSTPSLNIGVEAGEEPYQLSRIFSALRLPDGSVLVGNSGTGEIRVFDKQGKFVRSIGRRGNGPGEFAEFSTVTFVRATDGSLVAYDNGNLRVHYFDSAGAYRQSIRIEPTADGLRAFFQGLFGDGSWLTLALKPELRNEPGTYLKSEQQYVRFSADGKPAQVLRHVEGRTRFVNKYGSTVNFPFVPFTAEPLARASGDRMYVVASGAPEMEVRDLKGTLVRVARLALDLPRTADVYERYKEAELANENPERRAQYEHFYSQSHPIPEHVPAFQSLIVDDDANVWLERYRLPWQTEAKWEVVDASGRWLGSVLAPSRLRLYQVGRDFVLGRHLDTLGVERVRVHRLQR